MPNKSDPMSWNQFQVAMTNANQRTLYDTHRPGIQEARTGFFNSLKEYAPNNFRDLEEINTLANLELQGVIAMGMEDYKADPLSRAAIAKAPFDTQIPLGAVDQGLPQTARGSFPKGINQESLRPGEDGQGLYKHNRILLGGEPALESINRSDYEYTGSPGYPYKLENSILHENLHTVLPSTIKTDKGFYSLYGNSEAQATNDVIPDEEFRVRQLTNAYAERLGRPYPDFDKENIWLVDQESAEYFDRAVPSTQPMGNDHPTDKGFDFWSSL